MSFGFPQLFLQKQTKQKRTLNGKKILYKYVSLKYMRRKTNMTIIETYIFHVDKIFYQN